jgi:hypothetical protein
MYDISVFLLPSPQVFTLNFPGHPLPLNRISRTDSEVTSTCFSNSSNPDVEGVPAQKKAMLSPIFRSSSGRTACDIRVPATSHGFPMNTHGPVEDSIRLNPSHGEAGE